MTPTPSALPSLPLFARSLKPFVDWAVLFAALALGLAADLADYRQVVDPNGKIFFVDADCYARMTRVREVCIHPGTVMRHHEFENYPAGITAHTTVPLDYLTAGLRGIFGVLRLSAPRDLAGAWISPLLGMATVFALWWWTRAGGLPGRGAVVLMFAASPIVGHGFAFGRPDHQSLEIACLALALAAEWAQWRQPSRNWGIVSGAAWAVGLWTSLYEPLILIFAVVALGVVFNRRALFRRERLPGAILGGVILLAALLCEGWRIGSVPGFGESAAGEYFAAWSTQIGELQSMLPSSPALYHWTGWGILAAPFVLWVAPEELRPLARAQLVLLVLVFGLTCWQARWGYFLPLVYVATLPVQFAAIPAGRWRAVAGGVLILGCWPMASEWRQRLHPTPELAAQTAEQHEDMSLLRETAFYIAGESARNADAETLGRGILAPWWLSPALAYWSRQPAVAGSSHESLPGIVDVDRFYLEADPRAAAGILRARQVRWVVAYEPERVAMTASSLLGRDDIPARSMCVILYERPDMAPPFLRLALVNPYFKVYEVQPALLPPP